MDKKFSLLDWVFAFQGSYYLLTGLWPVVHLESFETVTGPKDSIFLLHMVSALIIVVAITLLLSLKNEKTRSILFLAVGAPLSFMSIEIFYRAQIQWVYFLDFAVEAIILAALAYGYIASRRQVSESSENNQTKSSDRELTSSVQDK